MINISFETHPEEYKNYLKSLEFIKSINDEDFNYPNEVTYFHVYTEVKNEKELACIKSFFATQNLDKTKLILWSDYDISNQENLIPFKNLIDFRIYDPIEESKGTPMEGNFNHLKATDFKYYLKSDLLRLLALYNYGGIWIDMDIILLRDFKPLLDQEFLYQWGHETAFDSYGCCGSVLSLKRKSNLSRLFLEILPHMPVVGDNTFWGKDLFAQAYKHYKYTIFPSPFFNLEWQMGIIDNDLKDLICLKLWFDEECPDEYLFLDSFSWHWHNSFFKNRTIQPNSKFDKLSKIIDVKLEERGFFV